MKRKILNDVDLEKIVGGDYAIDVTNRIVYFGGAGRKTRQFRIKDGVDIKQLEKDMQAEFSTALTNLQVDNAMIAAISDRVVEEEYVNPFN